MSVYNQTISHIANFAGVSMPSIPNATRCRICRKISAILQGSVEFYVGYSCNIYDCLDCGCRFTGHDNSVYDILYREPNSRYGSYLDWANLAKTLFDRNDLAALRSELCKIPKYRFIIDQIASQPGSARILEIGCSRGFLTSYFILQGRDIIGADISPTAVSAAATAFGEHFFVMSDTEVGSRAPYDVIYHVGTIGCVDDPVDLIRNLLGLLKPGGGLLFNAPNRDACMLPNQLWVSAPPPDLVTMFPPGFWRKNFADVAEVLEEVQSDSPRYNLTIALRRIVGRRWKAPSPKALSGIGLESTPPTWVDRTWKYVEHALLRLGAVTGFDRLAPRQPAEFGLIVMMTKR